MRPVGPIVFGKVYPMYVAKAERKGRSKAEVDEVIRWLTGYDDKAVLRHVKAGSTFEQFFAQAPAPNPGRALVKGVICGVRIEDLTDPVTRDVRILDKLIDELAKGKAMDKVLRQPA